ncbi:MAG: glutaredoxin family protein [Pseudomonadota bacterium]|jgi:glutaredoxin|uniref:glutaredoxin family protein n=1 Tax=Alcanivorax sp. TaxID=1872427 RepID=UPI00243AA2FD|nr:glutaredoxin family protein [Alcanivorax sp.]MED5240292.1 glutaredoxin family protein [Pseudomonadota bacterium]MEE3319448.1 glutaredoxin family protein [Pseudomonadota bacterium]
MTVVLYTTLGCHLCEQAKEMLVMVNPNVEIESVDVAEEDDLIAQYGERIPVLARKGHELAWPFGLLDVQAFLQKG